MVSTTSGGKTNFLKPPTLLDVNGDSNHWFNQIYIINNKLRVPGQDGGEGKWGNHIIPQPCQNYN